MEKHIYPIFDRLLQRGAKEKMIGQHSKALWFTGLSGSGKSTVAENLEARLHANGFLTQVLDGDNIRNGLNSNLTFAPEDRVENIRRISEVTKLFVHCGIITLNSFISPTVEMRQMAKDIIGEDNFVEVFINASLESCEARDVKGLYAKARSGEIKGFTGIDAPYEAPPAPAIELRTDQMSIEETVDKLYNYILPLIKSE